MQSSDVWLYPKPWVSDTTTCVWMDGKDTRMWLYGSPGCNLYTLPNTNTFRSLPAHALFVRSPAASFAYAVHSLTVLLRLSLAFVGSHLNIFPQWFSIRVCAESLRIYRDPVTNSYLPSNPIFGEFFFTTRYM